MKLNGTLIFLGLFLLVGSVTAYQYFHSQETKTAEIQKSLLIQLEKDQISEMSYTSSTEKFQLHRDQNGWSITEPYNDQADPEHMENFISTVISEKSSSTAKEGDGIDWSLFGLKDPLAIYEFKDQSGKSVRIQISAIKNFEGNPYLRRNDENSVLVGGLAWSNFASKKVFDFRNKKVFRSSRADISELIWTVNRQKKIHLVQKDSTWVFANHSDWIVDQNEVRSLLTSLSEWKASDISKTKPAILKNTNGAQLVLKLKDQNWTLNLQQDQKTKKVSGKLVGADWTYQLEGSFFDKLQNETDRDYRDHKKPFEFDKKIIQKIAIQTPLKKMIFVKNAGVWALEPAKVESKAESSLDQTKLNDFIERVRGFEAAEYVLPEESKGHRFVSNHRVEFQNDKNEVVFLLEWSDQKVSGLKDKSYLWAKTSQQKEPFYMESSSLDLLSPSQLMIDKDAKK